MSKRPGSMAEYQYSFSTFAVYNKTIFYALIESSVYKISSYYVKLPMFLNRPSGTEHRASAEELRNRPPPTRRRDVSFRGPPTRRRDVTEMRRSGDGHFG